MNYLTEYGDFSGMSDSIVSSQRKLAELYFSSPHFSYKSCDSKNECQLDTLVFLVEKNKGIIDKSNKFTVSVLIAVVKLIK